MKLHLEWTDKIPLKDGTRENLIYLLDLKKLPSSAGIYVFGRKHGKRFEALYVGQANDIRSRVKTQLNNLRLMNHLRNAKAGKRIALAGKFVGKRGQQSNRCIPLIERAFIRYFLSEGNDLVNVQGTRLRQHEIESTGKHPKRFFPGMMFLDR